MLCLVEFDLARDNPSVPAPTGPYTPQSPGAPPPTSSPAYNLRGSTIEQTEGSSKGQWARVKHLASQASLKARGESSKGDHGPPSEEEYPSSSDSLDSDYEPHPKKTRRAYKDAEDEVTVNTALILFAEAAYELIPQLKCDWCPLQNSLPQRSRARSPQPR